LVRAGVAQILALEEDAGAAAVAREAVGEVERGGPTRVVAQEGGEAPAEARGGARGLERPLKLDEGRHERLGHEAAAEPAEAALGVRQPGGIEPGDGHQAPFPAATKRRTLSASFRPGRASTPELTSTA